MSELLTLKTILVIALVFVPLERITSLHREQKILRTHWANDLIYLFFNIILIKIGLVLLIGVAMMGIRLAVPDVVGATVRSQPLWLQAIEVIVVADCGFYAAHRAFHEVPLLWRFHAIHHSIEEMDWLAAHRVHPVDQILTKAASVLPVFALGFSDAAIAIFALSYQCQSLLIHSNTRIGFGPLRWVLASPPFHHWHHANEPEAIDKNFAAQLPFIDALGGTLCLPPQRMPARYGTDDPVPALYHQQMVYPLTRGTSQTVPTDRLARSSGRPSSPSASLAAGEDHPDLQLDESRSGLPG